MFHAVLPTRPISDLRKDQPAVLASLRRSPVVLTLEGRGLCVLAHLRQWNYLIEVYNKAKDAGLLEVGDIPYEDEHVAEKEVV